MTVTQPGKTLGGCSGTPDNTYHFCKYLSESDFVKLAKSVSGGNIRFQLKALASRVVAKRAS